ncbi:B-cell receptor-associated protein 29 [Intoshia linei]|uniref:Endoplasmic reticulum transmembrane protein n=1 Tax=Intoshia linei TaxID=1819745 RepID=A0A177AVH4_9BILA|nr:B-cell receptor-associated protein 29 [Intoshia linei]
MALQWTLVLYFLYLEVAITLILLLPISTGKTRRIMRLFAPFKSFYVFRLALTVIMAIMIVLLYDAYRGITKYSLMISIENPMSNIHANLNAAAANNIYIQLFRAQRNMYLSFISILLALIIWRLTALIETHASLVTDHLGVLKQAKNAGETARQFMEMNENKNGTNLHKELEEMIESKDKQIEAIKKQAESTNREFDKLTTRYEQLESKQKSKLSSKKKD